MTDNASSLAHLPSRRPELRRHPPLAALVRLGLATAWEQLMPADDTDLPRQLRQQALMMTGSPSLPDWKTLRDHYARQLTQLPGPFGRWVREQSLDLPQAFLLALVGSAETDYLITLTLAELQAPNSGNRLAIHLALHLLDLLFEPPALDSLDLQASPLLRQHLLQAEGNGPLTLRTLQIEPALWSVLCGRPALWPGCQPIPLDDHPLLPRRLRQQLPSLASLLAQGDVCGLVIRGHPGSGRHALAAELGQRLGLAAIQVPAALWFQQPAFTLACQLAGWLPVVTPTTHDSPTPLPPVNPAIPHVLILGMTEALASHNRLEVETGVPDASERHTLWQQYLASSAGKNDEHSLATSAASALLSGPMIRRLARNARLRAEQTGEPLASRHITQARHDLGMEKLRLLAQPVPRQVHRNAIVFPPLVEQQLTHFLQRARRRESLWQALGTTLQASVSPGLRALFTGDSGTGKTLAASHVATELGAPLYRVDLAAIMNKYVGESEKNLGTLLDLAAATDALLLFDEADSLFGRRTDARQSGERYANMLTNFLLTRIENHPGIIILTTNSRERIDSAFSRRLDCVVEFPLPGFNERLALWQGHLGERSPGPALCKTLASYCDLCGGQIRNVVLAAALDGTPDQPIAIAALLGALQREYQKLGRNLPAQLENLSR